MEEAISILIRGFTHRGIGDIRIFNFKMWIIYFFEIHSACFSKDEQGEPLEREAKFVEVFFLSDPGIPGVRSMGPSLSNSKRLH